MSGLVGFEAWAELAGDSPTSRTEWASLVAAWSEPHRRYHDLAHLAAVLGIVGVLAGSPTDPDAVRLAAWYHTSPTNPTARTTSRSAPSGRGWVCAVWCRTSAWPRCTAWCC